LKKGGRKMPKYVSEEKKPDDGRAAGKTQVDNLCVTTALLASQVWPRVYGKMREPDSITLARELSQAAQRFEKEWRAKSFDERDGYYIDAVDRFAEDLEKELMDLFGRQRASE